MLVAVRYVGVCGTDLQILNGDRPDAARILGHEGGGRVEEVGPGAPEGLRRQTVVFNPVNPADPGEILGHSYDGLMQEKFLVPARRVNSLLPVGPRFPAPCAPLVEPLATAVYGHELVREVCVPKRVAVVGAGPVGLLYAIHARRAGAEAVYLLHRSPARLAWAIASGVVRQEEAVPVDAQAKTRVDRATGGAGVDAAFLCTTRAGARAGLEMALSLVRDGGCVDLVSGFLAAESWDGVTQTDLNEVRGANVCGLAPRAPHRARVAGGKRVWLTGHRGTADRHLREALALVRASPRDFARVVTHVVPLRRAAAALSAMARGRLRTVAGRERVKVVVDVGGSF